MTHPGVQCREQGTVVPVTETEDDMTPLTAAIDRLDKAEVELEAAYESLGGVMRSLHDQGASASLLAEETGFSRGHVYDLMGGPDKPRTQVRREKRRQIREQRKAATS